MRTGLALFVILLAVANVAAQDAAQPAVTSSPTPIEQLAPPAIASPTPILPELETLDQAFNQTGLGKDADELRMRVEMRKLQNQIALDPDVIAAKTAANAATTDLEKRERLKEYYEKCYGLMSQKASTAGLKAAITRTKQEKIALLAQPRVRPGSGGTEMPAPTPKKKKKKKSGKKF
jgi:hypothetical protein